MYLPNRVQDGYDYRAHCGAKIQGINGEASHFQWLNGHFQMGLDRAEVKCCNLSGHAVCRTNPNPTYQEEDCCPSEGRDIRIRNPSKNGDPDVPLKKEYSTDNPANRHCV